MGKLWWLAFGIILAGLLAGPVVAGGIADQGAPQAVNAGVSGVSPVQQDIMNKKEQARQRKKEMLQVRAQTIKAEAEMSEEEKAKLKIGVATK